MVKLIAIKEVRYAGVARVPGTPSAEFEAPEKDARVLKAVKKATDAPVARPVEQAKLQEQPKQPELPSAELLPKAEAPAEEQTPPGRRRYLRRDMTAGGD